MFGRQGCPQPNPKLVFHFSANILQMFGRKGCPLPNPTPVADFATAKSWWPESFLACFKSLAARVAQCQTLSCLLFWKLLVWGNAAATWSRVLVLERGQNPYWNWVWGKKLPARQGFYFKKTLNRVFAVKVLRVQIGKWPPKAKGKLRYAITASLMKGQIGRKRL